MANHLPPGPPFRPPSRHASLLEGCPGVGRQIRVDRAGARSAARWAATRRRQIGRRDGHAVHVDRSNNRAVGFHAIMIPTAWVGGPAGDVVRVFLHTARGAKGPNTFPARCPAPCHEISRHRSTGVARRFSILCGVALRKQKASRNHLLRKAFRSMRAIGLEPTRIAPPDPKTSRIHVWLAWG